MLFKLLLLERLYNLSDGDAVWMARDSLSFRSFLGLGAGDRVPDDTTLVKPAWSPPRVRSRAACWWTTCTRWW